MLEMTPHVYVYIADPQFVSGPGAKQFTYFQSLVLQIRTQGTPDHLLPLYILLSVAHLPTSRTIFLSLHLSRCWLL
jgi:hypothetical protein